MGALSLLRVVRRVPGLGNQPEYPNLEALLEAESGQPGNDYRIASRVAPPIVGAVGLAIFIPLAILRGPAYVLGAIAFAAIAGALWLIFDQLDKRIPPAKKRIRELCEGLLKRYRGFGNMVGVEPALSPAVGKLID